MKDLFTIIYYTSNRENEIFEEKIKKKLLEVSKDIPIISVSQKPIDFGKNICVGNVGANYINLHRQIEIGCKEAKTPFVIAAEADCLYPPDYFNLKPSTEERCYLYNNVYILRTWEDGFLKKGICFGALIAGREFYLKRLAWGLRDKPMWWKTLPADNIHKFWDRSDFEFYGTKNPVISFKTGNGVNKITKTTGELAADVPYWGDSKTLREEFG